MGLNTTSCVLSSMQHLHLPTNGVPTKLQHSYLPNMHGCGLLSLVPMWDFTTHKYRVVEAPMTDHFLRDYVQVPEKLKVVQIFSRVGERQKLGGLYFLLLFCCSFYFLN